MNTALITESPLTNIWQHSTKLLQIFTLQYGEVTEASIGRYFEAGMLRQKVVKLANITPFTDVLHAYYFLLQLVVPIRVTYSPIFYPPIGSD